VLALLWQVRAALAISLLLPATVLCTFLLMRLFQVEANIVALAGIAIAIGTIVDLGIIFTENVLRQRQDQPALSLQHAIMQAGQEVGPAILTAISTTIISFLPVFAMTGAEGKLFGPLAYTKTFVLLCAVLLAVTLLPVLLYLLFAPNTQGLRSLLQGLVQRIPAPLLAWTAFLPSALLPRLKHVLVIILLVTALVLLSQLWLPLGPAAGFWHNLLLVSTLLLLILGGFWLFQRAYLPLLALCLRFKALFIVIPLLVVLTGLSVWLGADRVIPGVQADSALAKRFPGLGREFMPALDEGAFLFMPSLMPHTSISEALAVLQRQDKAIAAIPEVKSVVGKIGRADTALDPAPLG
ncbi:MAG: efflux RND transporter permease subunit, partial [Alishewanella sp.]|nr:efflux RND transporter permease subunit [Alishewanella sp.]